MSYLLLTFFIILTLLITLLIYYIMKKPDKPSQSIARQKIQKPKTGPGKKPVLQLPEAQSRQKEINEFARKNPELVGQVIKQWLKEEGNTKN